MNYNGAPLDPTDSELQDFWDTYIGDSEEINSDGLNQVFAKGQFAGYSIRDMMYYAARRLGKPRPKEISERHQ